MTTITRTTITEVELKRMIQQRLGYEALLTIHRHPGALQFTAGVMTTPERISSAQAMVDQIVDGLRGSFELADDDVPKLSTEPAFEPRLQTVFFEFWKGNVRQAASLKVQQMDAISALRFFHQHWPQIGAMAAKTPPTDGEVKLVITG